MLPRLSAIFAALSLTAVATAMACPGSWMESTERMEFVRECGTDISLGAMYENEMTFDSLLEETRGSAGVTSSPGNFTVPVYFHVITAGNALSEGNVPDSQIHDQIRVLNKDFINSGLKFDLKEIIRTQNQEWFEYVASGNALGFAMKSKLRRGDAKTLNVFTVGFTRAAGSLGFATFPADYTASPAQDGVVVLFSTLPGGTRAPFNGGRTLTHEVGHWVGLYHTFQGFSCTGPGDYVDDTPAEKSPSYGCDLTRDTCPEVRKGPDPVQNYMDYSFDSCMTNFTPGQIARLRAQIEVFRGVRFVQSQDTEESYYPFNELLTEELLYAWAG